MSSSIDTAPLIGSLRAMQLGYIRKQEPDPNQVICAPWARRDIGDMYDIKDSLDWLLGEIKSGFNITEHRHGWIIRNVIELGKALERKERDHLAKAGFRPDQPRHPAGSSIGGRWSGGDGSAGGGGRHIPQGLTDISPVWDGEARLLLATESGVTLPRKKPSVHVGPKLRQPPDYPTARRASAIYGETSGLTPQLKNPKVNPYTPENWDEDSAQNLAKARAYVGIVSERNPRVHFSVPPDSANSIETRVWDTSVEAAVTAGNSTQLDERVTNFFLRQEGVGRQKPERWPATLEVLVTMGPFNNVGGGDVPRGQNTYIDFYGKKE